MDRRQSQVLLATFAVVAAAVAALVVLTGRTLSEVLSAAIAIALLLLAYDIRRRFVHVNARLAALDRQLVRYAEQAAASHASQADSLDAMLADSGNQLEAVTTSMRTHEATIAAVGDGMQQLRLDLSVAREAIAATLGRAVTSLSRTQPTGPAIATIVRRESGLLYRQLEALHRLENSIEVSGMTPALRGWAVSPDVLAVLVSELHELRPGVVLECGSGASTVWLAMAIRSARLPTRIVSLEHDADFANATRQALRACGVDDLADIRVAPLVPWNTGPTPWYDRAALAGVADIGLVFVDGPPGDTGMQTREPAMAAIHALLAGNATVVLDDTIRDDEASIARTWELTYPDFVRTDVQVEKGAAVFRRRRDQ